MLPTTSGENSFGEIALCLSGGGYRAAAYHLGVLRTLEELNLLNDVKYFSTASGGTITAMKYIVTKLEDKPFDIFYQEIYSFLHQTNVVAEAFDMLEETPCPAGLNDLSLIRSGAEVYRQKLTGMKTLENSANKEWTIKDLQDEISGHGTFHDLIFNSTEFRTGNNFRFRAVADPDLLFGNRNTPVREELFTQISLADIVAASSCFPGVFEPIRFPEDFQLADRTETQRPFSVKNEHLKTIALMDGGILDNQGLYGMTISYKDEPLPFDLMIVSDTSARNDELLKYDIEPRRAGLSLKSILWLGIGFVCLLLFCSLALFGKAFTTQLPFMDLLLFGFLGAFLSLLSISILGLMIWGLSKIKFLSIMGADFPIWKYFQNLTVSDVRTLFAGRLFSAKVMTFSVFMNRIRALQLSSTMGAIGRKTRNDLFNGKTVFVDIYNLSPLNDYQKARDLDLNLEPTYCMKQLSEDAEKIGTKLWLNEKELNILINCGRITICQSLLNYVWKAKKFKELPKPNDKTSPFYGIYEKWMELRTEFQ